jgi:asparagine synthase (glutamine-hydrolysing)
MCGIAGLIERTGIDAEHHAAGMAAAMTHRGPDGTGAHTLNGRPDGCTRLAHRRLAIIDLSDAGRQPMANPQTGDWLIFNGEIYNYRELRRELAERGHRFTSHTDTEVILKGYAEWGLGVLERLRGMFAFALVDARDHSVLLARDRLGLKPLYYAQPRAGGVPLLFASEVRALLASGLVPRRLSGAAVAQYLVNGYVPDPLTIVAGVHSLLPGHYALFAASGALCKLDRYWPGQATASAPAEISRAEAVRRVRGVLDEIVAQHMLADVPLGAFLSGGIDSSVLVALMTKIAPGQVETFSLVFDDPRLSEAPYSRAVAEQLCTKHHECHISEAEFLALMEDGLAALDQPTVDAVNSYVVARKCRAAGLKVALTGTGGDELFGGYDTFARVPKMLRLARALQRAPAPLRLAARGTARGLLLGASGDKPSAGKRAKLAALFDLPPDALALCHLTRMVLLPPAAQAVLHPALRNLAASGLPGELESLVRLRAARHTDPRAQVSVFEQMLYLSNMLLRDTDSVSMAVSLEVRVPLLDHVLLETIEALPPQIRFGGPRAKQLLIDAVGDILPRACYERRKQGFVLPLGRWLAGPLRAQVAGTLADPQLLSAAGLEPAGARAAVADCLDAGERIYFNRLWGLFVLVDWCRRNQVRFQG